MASIEPDAAGGTPGGSPLGVVAAGHQLSAQFGAAALRAGGNAVDAALGALLASFTCEPLLTGLGAGGYMLIVGPQTAPVLLDFFVTAPGLLCPAPDRAAAMAAVEVSFGHALQTFHGGPASCGVYGVPAGIAHASGRYGRLPLSALTAPAAALARAGAPLSDQQAYVVEIVGGLASLTAESRALFAPAGRLLTAGEPFVNPELGDALELLGEQGATPFYDGEIAERVQAWMVKHGGAIRRADLGAYAVIERTPLAVEFRGRTLLTNPPPAAGGLLMTHTLQTLAQAPAPVGVAALVAALADTHARRTAEFARRLGEDGFACEFLGAGNIDQLGSTTHVAALDANGLACSMTTSNGSSSGVVVPGTGIHLNNMLGEGDLNPGGFHQHAPGRRLPSMMSPTVVLRDGVPELVLGSAGSARIRSAVLQTVLRVIDEGMTAQPAIDAPRLHFEDGTIYAEPGVDLSALAGSGYEQVRFHDRNLYFGGVQAVQRDREGRLWGGGDPRRGGAAVVVAESLPR